MLLLVSVETFKLPLIRALKDPTVSQQLVSVLVLFEQ